MALTVETFAAKSPLAAATIRNTFLEFREDAPSALRRSRSAPPLTLQVVSDDKAGCDFLVVQDACSTPSALSDAGEEDAVDASTEASFDDCSPGFGLRRRWSSFCDEDPSDVVATLSQVPFVPATPLNPRARTWTPIASPEIQPPRHNFQEKAVRFVEDVAAELRQLPCCKAATAQWQHMPGGVASCTLLALVLLVDNEIAEQMTTAAKKTMHSASLGEKGVELMGCKAQPFSPTPEGFVAVLGNPQIRRKRCAKVYEQGVCPYGSTCSRLHPTFTVSLNFVVAVSNM